MIKEITDYINWNNGKLYAPIPYDKFEGMESTFSSRGDVIIGELRNHQGIETVLDVGSHWGSICYDLEKEGYDVTATELKKHNYKSLVYLRDQIGAKFKTLNVDILNGEYYDYDAVICLNIFHHFLKNKIDFDKFVNLLKTIKFKVMIFQAHSPDEKQMMGSYKNFDNDEFRNFIMDFTGKKSYNIIMDGDRPIYSIF